MLCLCVVALLCYLGNIGCIWRALLRFPCPTCGVTRALLSLLCLDLPGYLQYNAMALPLLVATIALLFLKDLPRKKLFFTVSLIILLCNIGYYLVRLTQGSI